LKVRDGRLVVVDKIEIEPAKTKIVAKMMVDLELSSALIVVDTANPGLQRAARNLSRVKVVRAEGATVYDILRYQHLVLTIDAVVALKGRVTG
jgi:large subunit ribosomal protein L4